MAIDLYDFDKTVYPTDSTTAFWLWCLLHRPWIVVYLPIQIVLFLLYGLKILNTRNFKSLFLRFVALINTKSSVKAFWDKHQTKIYHWFLPENREQFSVVASASPDFLLTEICNRLKVDKLICTHCSEKSGKIIGENCKGKEKVTRLKKDFPDAIVNTVYSDDLKSDAPIFALGKTKTHTVNGKRITLQEATNE